MPDYRQLIRKKGSTKALNRSRGLLRGKKVPKNVFVALTGIIIIACLVLAARYFLISFPGFTVKCVSIVNEKFDPIKNSSQIFQLEDKPNLFSLDIRQIARDIRQSHPEFSSVSARKRFPDTLVIILRQRKPVAIIVSSGTYMADKEAFILPFESSMQALPKIVGINPNKIEVYSLSSSLRLKKALALLAELQRPGLYPKYKVDKIDVRRYNDVIFYFDNGIEVKMGEGNFKRKAILLGEILAQLDTDGSVPKYIDMRFETPAVMP